MRPDPIAATATASWCIRRTEHSGFGLHRSGAANTAPLLVFG
jgi:hypothetical protein